VQKHINYDGVQRCNMQSCYSAFNFSGREVPAHLHKPRGSSNFQAD